MLLHHNTKLRNGQDPNALSNTRVNDLHCLRELYYKKLNGQDLSKLQQKGISRMGNGGRERSSEVKDSSKTKTNQLLCNVSGNISNVSYCSY